MTKRPKEKKWGNRLVNGREEKLALGIETLVGGTILSTTLSDSVSSLREAGYDLMHAVKTVSDAVQGGPEGMRAAKNLDEALRIVENAKTQNQEATAALQDYYAARKDFVTELVGVYKENEVLSRECQRLKVQLEGTLKNFFEAGNQLKPQIMREIDNAIIKLYGMDPVEALEKSERLKEFYGNVRIFYDSREKNENTIKEFCNYLAKTQEQSANQNQRIEGLFPELIQRVKEGYTIEDYIFNVDGKGANMGQNEVTATGNKVHQYEGQVDKTRDNVGNVIELPGYSGTNWIDIATNPFVMAAAGVMLLKGVSRAFLPNVVDNLISKAVCYPVKLTGNIATYLYDAVSAIHDRFNDGGKE